MWWRRQPDKSRETAVDASLPLIRLEGIGKTFRGEADEETARPQGRDHRHRPRRIRLSFRTVRVRQVDVPGDSGSARDADDRAVLAQRPRGRPAAAGRARPRAQHRRRAGLSELQPDWRHDGRGERRVPAHAAGRRREGTEGTGPNRARPRRTHRAREAAARTALRRSPATGRHRARDRRPSTDPARRRADGQSRLEERRRADADARRAARRRRDGLPRDAQPGLRRQGAAARLSLRWQHRRHSCE